VKNSVYKQGLYAGAGSIERISRPALHPQARAFHDSGDANRQGNNDK
jgi:hypothetical protein